MEIDRFPEAFRRDIQIAISVLRQLGARQVFIFGSLVESSDPAAARDIDIAVEGLPPESFFHAYGQLVMSLDHQFDLVDLTNDAAFVRHLKEKRTLERVA